MALENREIMEHLANFLDNQALGSLYDSCQTVRNNIDELKLWKKRGHKLGKIARIFDKGVDEETMKEEVFRVLSKRLDYYYSECTIQFTSMYINALLLFKRLNLFES